MSAFWFLVYQLKRYMDRMPRPEVEVVKLTLNEDCSWNCLPVENVSIPPEYKKVYALAFERLRYNKIALTETSKAFDDSRNGHPDSLYYLNNSSNEGFVVTGKKN